MEYKTITTTKGDVIKVDCEDYKFLSKYNWYVRRNGYVECWESVNGNSRIHRVIMNAPKDKVVDHVNGDKLDNRRCNLRLCSQSQNSMNRKVRSNKKSSSYKGVYKQYGRYRAAVWDSSIKKNKYSILYDTEIEAVLEYNRLATEMFGEYARLNEINAYELIYNYDIVGKDYIL